MYSFRDVHKRYGLRTVALRRINLDIESRDFFVLYGPAGAGKSTMLNVIAGITKPTSGDILRDGKSIVGLPPDRRDAAMAFENYALYSHLSVGENLGFPLRARGMGKTETEDRVKKIADTLEIGHLLDRRPGFLSGGQRQRVALGRAIIRPADIYLLDEPIGHLDAKLRHRMRAELKALAEELNATVVFTTTSSREALALADRMAVINEGRLEQVGTPSELYNAPANAFVASFVGDPPMSFMKVEAVSDGERARLVGHGGRTLGSAAANMAGSSGLSVGLRADAIRFVNRDEAEAVPAHVRVIEHLGYSNIAVVDVGEDQLSVSLSADSPVRPGEELGLKIDPDALHLFRDEVAVKNGGL